ncbi:hypothetical protein CK203_026445 [Vitis vinifera]|uniref:Uncharacterized protein n=1 Tax=Vitis vinifera TaxID=29760 RepID=A0A438IVX3_VITVI|nr:hypothetical protein CK203_026445 [Vitis vinifera]
MGSDVVFGSLYLDRIVSLMMIDLVSPDFLTYHTSGATLGHIPFHLRFMDPHGLARSSLTGCSLRRGHDRYLTEPLRSIQPGPHFSTLGFHHASPSGRSPLVYMIIHGYEIHARSMFDLILSGYSEEPLLSHSARFIPFDIVVWSCLWCLDFPRHHFRGIRSVTRPIGVILGSSEQIGAITIILFRLPEPFLSSRFGFQSHHCHLAWAFRAITVILLRLPEPLLPSRLGFQSHYYHLVWASRAISAILFRLPEPSLSFCLGFQNCYLLSFYFLSLVLRVGLVIQSHYSWRSCPLALHILPSGFCIRPQLSSLRYPVLIAYSPRTPGWFDRYSSLTLIF